MSVNKKLLSTRARVAAACCLGLLAPAALHAQARPTAQQGVQLSAWGGASGTYVGLNDGHNLGITAGADVGLRRYFGLNPSIEIRGTYPVKGGQAVAERSLLAGVKVERPILPGVRAYVDVLAGRGQLNYIYPLPNRDFTFFYLQSTTNVFSAGLGFDVPVTRRFSLRADGQIQHWSTPVTPTGHIYSVPITAAVVYRFDFNGLRHFPTR